MRLREEPEEIIDPWEDCPNCESKDEEIEGLKERVYELEEAVKECKEYLDKIEATLLHNRPEGF